jgi:hypothetical protein
VPHIGHRSSRVSVELTTPTCVQHAHRLCKCACVLEHSVPASESFRCCTATSRLASVGERQAPGFADAHDQTCTRPVSASTANSVECVPAIVAKVRGSLCTQNTCAHACARAPAPNRKHSTLARHDVQVRSPAHMVAPASASQQRVPSPQA